MVELPPIHPQITEYQRHRLQCPSCGITACGELPPGVLPLCYRPRLASIVALGTGGYRMSKRMVASLCREGLGMELSLGEISQIEQTVTTAVAPAVEEAAVYERSCDLHIDETPWKERRRHRTLRAMVTTQHSVFAITTARGVAVRQQVVGDWYSGFLTSDRAKVYDSYALRQRQVCWSHLRGVFQAMIDRSGPGQGVGEALLEHAHVLFAWWHWVRDGTWERSTFQSYVRTLRASFKLELERGSQSACPKTAATCRELLTVKSRCGRSCGWKGLTPQITRQKEGYAAPPKQRARKCLYALDQQSLPAHGLH